MASDGGIQVIQRAGAIIRLLEGRRAGMTLPEIAQEVGLATSTVQRIVRALVDEGLLASDGPRSGFRIGAAILRQGAAAASDIVGKVHPILVQLSAQLEETVDLSVLANGAALFVDQVVGPARLAAVSAVGEHFPLHCTANGKILLAHVAPSDRTSLLGDRLAAYTARTITDFAQLYDELETVRASWLAQDEQEHTDGIIARATGFHDPFGRVFAISVPVPAQRFEAKGHLIERALGDVRNTVLSNIT